MRFSRAALIQLYILLIILNLVLRYPFTPHEIGWDSFAIHSLADTVSTHGYAIWWIHPTSVFGFYPYSYASAIPFLLSEFSQWSNLNTEVSILVINIFLGGISVFSGMLLGRLFSDDDLFQFLVAFGFSLSPGVVSLTQWTIGTRGLFIILTPLFIYAIFRSRDSRMYVLISIILFILLSATHHLFYLLLPLIASFILVVHLRYRIEPIEELMRGPATAPLLAGFLLLFTIPLVTGIYSSQGDSIYLIKWAIKGLSRYTGVLILPAFLGFLILLYRKKTPEEWIIVLSLLILTPFIFLVVYMEWFILPFTALLAAIGITAMEKIMPKQFIAVIISLIILSTAFVGYFQFIQFQGGERDLERHVEDKTLNAAIWARDYADGAIICIDETSVGKGGVSQIGTRILAFSGVPTLTGFSPTDYVFGFENRDGWTVSTRSPASISFYLDSPYKIDLKGRSSTSWAIYNLRRFDVDGKGGKILDTYGITYIVQKAGPEETTFMKSIKNENNLLYDNGLIKVWER